MQTITQPQPVTTQGCYAYEILKRHAANPILTADDSPVPARSIFNPGVTRYNGQYVMVANICQPHNPILFWIFRSDDGVHFTPDAQPMAWPQVDPTHREHCVYDPRITKIEDTYYLCYASQNQTGVRVGIVKTDDFQTFERVAMASEIENRNAALFPEKINGLYARLDRPFQGDGKHGMWLSYSPDLVFWGKSERVFPCRPGYWDGDKLGAGAVPIATDQGWLCVYHGIWANQNSKVYQLGVCLLDRDNPAKVIARGKYPILTPRKIYETTGFVSNVVFTANAVPNDEGMVNVYYGAADTCIGLAQATIEELLQACYT